MTPPPDLLATAGIGLLLGFRHAFEPDHLAAVSTLATRQGRVGSAVRLGLAWGAGHTASVGVVALAVIGLGVQLPRALWPAAELLVAALLMALGAGVVWRYVRGRWHMHLHAHAGATPPHLHLHSHANDPGHAHLHAMGDATRAAGFGLAHGLAGSGVIAVLLVAAAPSAALRLAYFAAFGGGTVVGMLGVSLTLGWLVRLASERGVRWAAALHVGSAAASVGVGLLLAAQVVGWI